MMISRSGLYGFKVDISNADLLRPLTKDMTYDLTQPFEKIRTMMYAMINSHFQNEMNPIGAWNALKPNTLMLKSLGIARLGTKRGGFKPNLYGTKAMMGSGSYYNSLQKSGNPLHKFNAVGNRKMISIGSNDPAVSNEWGKINSSKIFKGAYVPQRSVLWFDEMFVENAAEVLIDHFNDILEG